jgi:hypothetical protein
MQSPSERRLPSNLVNGSCLFSCGPKLAAARSPDDDDTVEGARRTGCITSILRNGEIGDISTTAGGDWGLQ